MTPKIMPSTTGAPSRPAVCLGLLGKCLLEWTASALGKWGTGGRHCWTPVVQFRKNEVFAQDLLTNVTEVSQMLGAQKRGSIFSTHQTFGGVCHPQLERRSAFLERMVTSTIAVVLCPCRMPQTCTTISRVYGFTSRELL